MTTKILIRSGISPADNTSNLLDMVKDHLGFNSGNLVYAYSLYRFLMADPDTEVVPDYYRVEKNRHSAGFVDRVNQEFSLYVIPLADVFRGAFAPKLKALTRFIRQLKIPVVLIGAGVSSRFDQNFLEDHPYDDVIKEFLTEVLNHSAMLGVRGENTVRFIEKFGFKAEQHVTAIGCPSLYTYGEDLTALRRYLEVHPDWKQHLDDGQMIITNNPFAPDHVQKIMRRISEQHPGSIFIPQRMEEMVAMATGRDLDYAKAKTRPDYPQKADDPLFVQGRARYFTDYVTWADFVTGSTVYVGVRLHGGIINLLHGVPTLLLAKDVRTMEVAEYHKIPYIREDELTGQESLEDLVKDVDFGPLLQTQKKNYDHYMDFLKANGVAHIGKDAEPKGCAPLDALTAKTHYAGALAPYVYLKDEGTFAEKVKANALCMSTRALHDFKGKVLGRQ